MSSSSSPAPALAQDAAYNGDGAFSFLYPLQIIRTDDAALIGDGTTHPCGLTLAELIEVTFQFKTISFTASPAWAGNWEFLPNLLHLEALNDQVSAESYPAIWPASAWYIGNTAGYNTALASRKTLERQLGRSHNPAWIVRTTQANTSFELRYLYTDAFNGSGWEDFTVYQSGGLYYPAIIAHFIQPSAELISYKIPGGLGLIADSDHPNYNLYSGYAHFFGKPIKIGDLGFPNPGDPPFYKDNSTMEVHPQESFNQAGG